MRLLVAGSQGRGASTFHKHTLLPRLWIGFAIMALLAAMAPLPPALASNGTIVGSEAYEHPFANREGWLDFVAGTPNGKAAAAAYAGLITAADYDRWHSGTTVTATRLRYASYGRIIKAVMVAPKLPGRYPVIIFNHGGVMQWGRIIVPEILEFHRLAERGYIVLASTYRGEGGSEGEPDMGGGDVSDSLALIDIAAHLPQADPSRIGMWGFSRGGLVTYGALKRSKLIAAAVIVGGPTDLVTSSRRAEFDEFVYPFAIRDYAADRTGALTRLSPINWPEKLAPSPILLLQGGDDVRVSPTEAIRMAAALQGLKRSYRFKLYEGGSHDLIEYYADVRQEIDRWFDLYLRDGKPAPANGTSVLPVEGTGTR